MAQLRALPGGAALPASPLVAVNLTYARADQRVVSGDEVAIISSRGRRMSIRTAIVRRAIDVAALLAEVQETANGATVVFLGHVREVNDGRAVTGIEYSAYGEMAERELAAIASECASAFGIAHLAIEHRLGALELGEASIAIVVAHAHRARRVRGIAIHHRGSEAAAADLEA